MFSYENIFQIHVIEREKIKILEVCVPTSFENIIRFILQNVQKTGNLSRKHFRKRNLNELSQVHLVKVRNQPAIHQIQ